MKLLARIISISFLMFISITLVSAQVSLGLKGGLNLAKDYTDVDEVRELTEYMPGVYIAVPVELQVSDYFAIQAELGFIQKGMKMVMETTEEYEPGAFQTMKLDTRMTYNFLSLPILAKGKFGSEKIKFFVIGGPEVGYALNGKAKVEMTLTNGSSTTVKDTEDINFKDDEVDRWDYGLILGVGAETQVGPGWITLDGRYNLGLNNYNQVDDNDAGKLYHRGIGILIGYKLPINK